MDSMQNRPYGKSKRHPPALVRIKFAREKWEVSFVRLVTCTMILRRRIHPTNEVYRELHLSALFLGWPMSLIIRGGCLLKFRRVCFCSNSVTLEASIWKDYLDHEACCYCVGKISSSLAKESHGWRELPCSHAAHMQVMKPQRYVKCNQGFGIQTNSLVQWQMRAAMGSI
ncbi:hypothetical protein VNO77_14995 [Canavalia gladiata]|uniref:Uncharacterized protein n=1 Tax=Canavalia gladiata TaxID=3824 RepID=A0AAN9M3H4_CANGL